MLTTLNPRAGKAADTAEFPSARNRHAPTPDRESTWQPARGRNGDPLPPAEHFSALHEIFEVHADARPDAVAIVFGNEKISYGRLERRANRLARHLCAHGVQRGALVAMYLPRGVDAYSALLGILKAGAAYVPIDPEYPADRVAFILENSHCVALVTTAELAESQAAFSGLVVRVDADRETIRTQSSARLPRNAVGVGPRDLCYVIYTSGSTGRPKGVMIEHRSACHLVCAEARIFAVRPVDRVYQGFSLAFDASVEEVWLAFNAGTTLVAATPEMAQAGPDLSQMLTDAGVTVLSCVPTLLAMLTQDVPTLRLLILGGEACPEHLVERWARPGRRIVNTYGPTEATVIATYTDLSPGKPVTIGKAVPGYRVYLFDDGMRPITNGHAGEIWIGGVAVARGYVGLPGSTKARFMPDPFAPVDEADARVYRTGDLGRFDHDGNIEFLGRADSQVKLRGFRVELTEIESVLMQAKGVRSAACAVREDVPGVQQLVGYIVPSNGHVDEEQLRALLRERLPAYMVPALIETVRELPRLPSGKLDRASLPAPRAREESARVQTRRPATDTEKRIAEVWNSLFGPHPLTVEDNFFLDLGGHSLLAARMVSELRKDPQFASISMADVYDHPTIALLAAALDGAAERRTAESTATAQREVHAGEQARHFCAGALLSGGLYFVYGFRALQWVTPYIIYFMLLETGHSVLAAAGWAVAGAVAVLPALLLAAIAVKWLVLGRIRAGRYPLWGSYYLRFWFVRSIVSALHLSHLCGTPPMPFVFRLFGARIGKDVHLETDQLVAFDLISIGDNTSIDDTAWLLGCAVEKGELVVGPIQIGQRCFVGTRCVLRENTLIEDGARLEDLSLLPSGARIPAGETWAGSPARRVTNANAQLATPPARRWVLRALTAALYVVLVLIVPALPLVAFVPGVALLMKIDPLAQSWLYLAAAPLVGASFVLLLTMGVVVFKRLLVGRVHAGTYPVHGGFYIRKWIVDQLLALSLDTVGSLHATLYLSPWYRALGAKLGRFVELSTATSTTPDLLEIGDGGTVADEVSFGDLDAVRPPGVAARSMLSTSESVRAERMGRPLDRQRFVARCTFVRRVLGHLAAVAPEALEFREGARRKPELVRSGPAADDHFAALEFNLSHSENILALAVAFSRDVGVDVEVVNFGVDVLGVAEANFAAEELNWLRALPPRECVLTFYRLWTRKEAMAKATGQGIAGPPAEKTAGAPLMQIHSFQFKLGEKEMIGALVHATEAGCRDSFSDTMQKDDFTRHPPTHHPNRIAKGGGEFQLEAA